MLVRSVRRLFASSSVFPGIDFAHDDPEPYTPAPLRLEGDDDGGETIEAQSKGSARRLLKDRYVDDGGYLQSRSPFPLKAPRWEFLDADRPEMTPEGALWEDMNHFVDYLTCQDVSLAHALNEMLLQAPQIALKQFGLIVELLRRPLCNHEVLGRGYVFTREPVLAPSVKVGQLVVAKQAEKLRTAMQYLYIWDADYLTRQLNHVQGVDLEILHKSGFLLVEAAELLHGSAGWTQARFVEVLQEMAVFLPRSASALHLLRSPFVLVELLLHHDRTMRRFLEIQRCLETGFLGMELLRVMGQCADWCLHREEEVFLGYLRWVPVLIEAQVEWRDALRLCQVLYSMWMSMELPLEEFLTRCKKLHRKLPVAFLDSLKECLDQDEAAWKLGSLYGLIQDCEEVVRKLGEVDGTVKTLFENIPSLLTLNAPLDTLRSNLEELGKRLQEWPVYGAHSVEAWLKLQPTLMLDPCPGLELYAAVWPVICKAFTEDERATFQQYCSAQSLLEAAEKLHSILLCLQTEHGRSPEHSQTLLNEKIDRLRHWRRHIPIPTELFTFVQAIPAARVAELLAMESEAFQALETSLFMLFGNSPLSVFTALSSMPELLTRSGLLEDAILVSRCRKLSCSDLRKEPFRMADVQLKLLIDTLHLTRTRTELSDNEVLDCLEAISEKNLLGEELQGMPHQLVQFCILCSEHPGCWDQFEDLMNRVHHPLLAEVRPGVVQKMKQEAFRAILCSPEIFLIQLLWQKMMQYLTAHHWTFAGLDVHTVLATEPVLFYYAVQEKWQQQFHRNAAALFEAPLGEMDFKRRGKSIVKAE